MINWFVMGRLVMAHFLRDYICNGSSRFVMDILLRVFNCGCFIKGHSVTGV